ncbi:MAG: acyltransferase, partial [Anaerolineae bacterium]|nr:acyltransferase [Anaerolineae bacterium]
LRKRSARQYLDERFRRLLIPFVFGCLLLTPVMLYFEWMHKTQTGLWSMTFWEFVSSRSIPLSCQIFGWAGYHLWFLGFLFSYSLLALPLFLWLRGDRGQRAVAWMIRLCERRGGILLAILPLLVIQLALRPFFLEGEHNWADFFYMLGFFALGYILYSHERFTQAIRRDWPLAFGVAATTSLIGIGLIAFAGAMDWLSDPAQPQFYVLVSLIVINGWSWVVLLLFVGMRFLDFSNRWLRYGQGAILPFFVFHQPVIMVIAFFVVQWDAAILPKALVVVPSSFVVTLGIYELLIRRSHTLQVLFGMKPSRPGIDASASDELQRKAHAR